MSLTMPGPAKTRLLLTRPAAQSRRFAGQVAARFGERFDCIPCPMVEIIDLPATAHFDAFDAVVFTSQNGVAAYKRLGGPAGKKAYCVGARTAEWALQLGLSAVSANGDLAALNALLAQDAPNARLLHLSGEDVAGAVTGNVTRVIAYRQAALPLTPQARALLEGAEPPVVCLFSAKAAAVFGAALPSKVTAPLIALCLSQAVADALPKGRFAEAVVPDAPSVSSLMDKMSDMFPA